MEPFSLLKFWRTAGSIDADSVHNANKIDVRSRAPETDEDSDSDIDSDDDSFFDLVLTRTAPDGLHDGDEEQDSIGNLIELESPLKINKAFTVDSSSNSKPQSPISLLRSAPKFRVFLLGFRKPKSEANNQNDALKATPKHQNQKPSEIHYNNEQRSKRFTVKYCKDELPIGSFFSRDNSLRSKLQRERSVDFSLDEPTSKQLPKDHVPMYLKLIKPLYNRASRRYTTSDSDKLRFPNWDQFSTVSPLSSPSTLPPTSPRKLSEERRGNRGTGFRVVSKHLGKIRAASSTVGLTSSSPASRRDDSLMLQHDGIQSAILHCKRSYNSSSIGEECSAMLRASHGKSMNQAIDFNSSSDRNRCSSI